MRLRIALVMGALLAAAAPAFGQATGLPSFLAPNRAFERSEFGAVMSFAEGVSFAIEGQYRMSAGAFDVGFRGGYVDPEAGADGYLVFGVEGRQRVITHSEDFPLDGGVILGVGALLPSGAERLNIPIGLSLGRRVEPENSSISFVPFVQPTLFILAGDVADNVAFALGLGIDLRLSRRFEARFGAGIGDLEGISIGAVWVH